MFFGKLKARENPRKLNQKVHFAFGAKMSARITAVIYSAFRLSGFPAGAKETGPTKRLEFQPMR
jgi:hypothetical protein